MIKIITNSFNFEESRAVRRIGDPRHVRPHIKSASRSELDEYVKALVPVPGRTRFHVLFLGAGEYYGSNKNGDWFGERDLKGRHETFTKFGHVFRHHVNKDPKKKYGDILKTAYTEMHRVEGLIDIDNKQNQDIIDKYESGEDLPVSMAAKLNHDVCSICGNKARTVKAYCDHLRYEMNKVYPDGRKVYAINPDPLFFDLSFVWRPADTTAYVLYKVAAYGVTALSAAWGEELYGSCDPFEKAGAVSRKWSIIEKLAALEKHVDGIVAGRVDDKDKVIKPLIAASGCIEDFPENVMSNLRKYPFESVITSLSDNGVMLTLKEFLDLIGMQGKADDVKGLLPGTFSRLLNDRGCDDDLIDIKFDMETSSRLPLYKLLKNFLHNRSINDNFFSGKTVEHDFENKPKTVVTFDTDGVGVGSSSSGGKLIVKKSENVVADRIAKLYNLYKVAFCEKHPNAAAALYGLLSNYC